MMIDRELSDAAAILIEREPCCAGRHSYVVDFSLLTPVPLFALRFVRKAASDDFASRSADAISCGSGWPANPSTKPGSGRARK
jgi:hypothetical protein